MLRKTKQGILELLDTILDTLDVLKESRDNHDALEDCLMALEVIEAQLSEDTLANQTLEQLKEIQASVSSLNKETDLSETKLIDDIKKNILIFKQSFDMEVKAKLNVLFLPYKASMWDSLASVYEAAVSDRDCIAKVVPIPYYQLAQDKAIPTYEGDLFPKDVPIIHYSQYSIEEEKPDIIFVHNIYDDYNTLTRVYDEYFTWNLKKHADLLVYIPYNVPSFLKPQKGGYSTSFSLPSVQNVDKIVLAGDYLREAAIREGIPKDKLLALGSPKLDAMVRALKEDIDYPIEWREKIEGKTVYLLNTGCLFFANNTFGKYQILTDIVNMTKFMENTVLIWRPHPLTEVSILQYTPYLYEHYKIVINAINSGKSQTWKHVIFDETPDYLPALKVADVLISDEGSLLRSYLLTERKVIYMDIELPKNSLLPKDAFYYYYNPDEPWYELVKRFSKGEDPLKENRKGLAAKVYANIDGTCGEKVLQSIKECFK